MADLMLDTSVLVAVERGELDVRDVVADEDTIAVAAITLAELRVGMELADGRNRARRERWVRDFAEVVEVIPYDVAVAVEHARLMVEVRRSGRRRGAHDLIIAATAAAHDRPVATADAKGFADLPGVSVVAV